MDPTSFAIGLTQEQKTLDIMAKVDAEKIASDTTNILEIPVE